MPLPTLRPLAAPLLTACALALAACDKKPADPPHLPSVPAVPKPSAPAAPLPGAQPASVALRHPR